MGPTSQPHTTPSRESSPARNVPEPNLTELCQPRDSPLGRGRKDLIGQVWSRGPLGGVGAPPEAQVLRGKKRGGSPNKVRSRSQEEEQMLSHQINYCPY